jgi:hypothetical protein
MVALHRSLGDSVTHLLLDHCSLDASFWAALLEHFPHLTHLRLKNGIRFDKYDLIFFCTSLGRPLQIHLPHQHWVELPGSEVRDSLRRWGVHQVHIVNYDQA